MFARNNTLIAMAIVLSKVMKVSPNAPTDLLVRARCPAGGLRHEAVASST